MKRFQLIVLKSLSGLAVLLFLNGCAASYYKLTSEDQDLDYYKGREVAFRQDNNSSTSVSFERQSNSNFVFYVTVENLSDSAFTFLPEKIFAEQLNENKELLPAGKLFHAVDPERHLEELSSAMKNRNTLHSVVSGLNLTFALVNVISDVSDSRSRHKLSKVSGDITDWANRQTDEENDYANDKYNISSESRYWENEVLRRTTLYKNDRAGGMVFVPFNPDAAFIRLAVPVNGVENIYLFKKITVN